MRSFAELKPSRIFPNLQYILAKQFGNMFLAIQLRSTCRALAVQFGNICDSRKIGNIGDF